MNWIKKNLYLLPVLLYLPAIFNFFSSDDWFHLRISQISSLNDFLNFFSFSHSFQTATFYRPLSTQTFFFVFQQLFGLTSWPYYLFVLICFAYSLHLVYRFAKTLSFSDKKAILVSIVYGFSVSNFTRVYFLSAFQEISLTIFSLLCLLCFPKSKIKSLLFFILALLSKETAIVLPLLIIVFYSPILRKKISVIIPFVIISLTYLYLRLFIFGIAQGDSYIWNFSPVKALNTITWYSLWSIGAPEFLVDYIGSGFRPISRFFTDFHLMWPIIICLLISTFIFLVVIVIKRINKIDLNFLKYTLLFLIPLAPVIFLPQHKFPLELGLSLVGFSLAITYLLPDKKTILSSVFFISYLTLNVSMNYLTFSRHYSINRGKISHSVYSFINQYYPNLPNDKYFEFVNDLDNQNIDWGQSKQIYQALSNSDFFRVYYKNNSIKVYYQDIVEERPKDKKPILLSSKQFLSK